MLAKEIERAGIPAVYVTSLPTVATMIGANRIVRGPAITHPFGLDEDERRRIVERALAMLEADVEPKHGARQELPVVADHDDAAALGLHEVLQQRQPVDVQVVRRLVQEVQVVPGQQQRGEPHPRRLPADSADVARSRWSAMPRSERRGHRSSRSAPPRASQA